MTLGWGLLVGPAAESCSQIWLPRLSKIPLNENLLYILIWAEHYFHQDIYLGHLLKDYYQVR